MHPTNRVQPPHQVAEAELQRALDCGELAATPHTEARLGAVVDAAHAAGLVIVALAVEDEQSADRVRRAGFDLAQGFYFARPQRPSRIDELLELR